ncbi:Mastermind-like protein 2 [Liparis tanakae]|uniref:Mastermind-like protein 2 n=1 Tax=Liparis tanakae TaxID=230148 RepID=A0A4Z2HUT3_9TELE|nr:Mastermind-like protein 2 [Liparis tanakae]
MGEATPAPGAFAPMLGVGLGTMPAGVGNGPAGATSRGSAVPQLHSAIVERLRARIELCRRHHSTCETRYQRGQAESSDREHESTLHLLNIVHQGPGNRKTKGSRGSNQQPPEYSRVNGELKGAGGDQKISTRIAVSSGETQMMMMMMMMMMMKFEDDTIVNMCIMIVFDNMAAAQTYRSAKLRPICGNLPVN